MKAGSLVSGFNRRLCEGRAGLIEAALRQIHAVAGSAGVWVNGTAGFVASALNQRDQFFAWTDIPRGTQVTLDGVAEGFHQPNCRIM
jgi:hypothetical protein